MKKMHLLVALLVSAVMASAVGAAEMSAQSNATVKVFRNVSGAATTHGTAFILQDASSDSNVLIGSHKNAPSTLGVDVTTTTSADSIRFVGCQVDDTCADDGLCRVVNHGPAICLWAGTTDNTNTRMAAVGTTTVAGQLGSGTLAGLTMSLSLDEGTEDTERNGAANFERRWIWVYPENN